MSDTAPRTRIVVGLSAGWLAVAGALATTGPGVSAAPGSGVSAVAGSGVLGAAPARSDCVEPGEPIAAVPWSQRWLAPERVWPFSRGGDTTVAVLDSGVDARHPQLGGEVAAGFDAIAGTGRADTDCRGTGTQVAGVIAAWATGSVGFIGLAPDVTILPIRVIDPGADDPAVPAPVLARGIRAALDRGAHVIAVSAISYTDSGELRAAVADALRAGVVVVAAVGDRGDAPDGGPVSYPAGYDGVIGVGAIGETGARWPRSQVGGYVDLVAPGADVVTLQAGGGMTATSGTGVACGFVAATAALARARWGLAGAEVVRYLLATAVPAPRGPEYGHGVVDPYAVVNDQVVDRAPEALPTLPPPGRGPALTWLRSRDRALAAAGLAGLAGLAVAALAVALPRGRRRFWRPAIAPPPARRDEPEEPGPPVLLFDEPL